MNNTDTEMYHNMNKDYTIKSNIKNCWCDNEQGRIQRITYFDHQFAEHMIVIIECPTCESTLVFKQYTNKIINYDLHNQRELFLSKFSELIEKYKIHKPIELV